MPQTETPQTPRPSPPAVPTEWKLNRQFYIRWPLMLGLGRAQIVNGIIYTVTGDLAITDRGHIFSLTPEDRAVILDIIDWVDDPQPISRPLMRLIAADPASPLVRGFVRAELGIVPAKAKSPKTTEGWMTYVKTTKKEPPTPRARSYVTIDTAEIFRNITATNVGNNDTVPVRVRGVIHVRGTRYFSRRDGWFGTIPVPRSIINEAREEGSPDLVYDFIYDHYDDFLDVDHGVEEPGDIEGDNDGEDGLELIETNIDDVLRDP